MKEKELLSVAEIAERYSVTPPAVRYWLSKGLPSSKRREIGKMEHVVIDPDDVDDYLRVGTIKTASKMN